MARASASSIRCNYSTPRAAAWTRRALGRCCSKASSWACGIARKTATRSAKQRARCCGGRCHDRANPIRLESRMNIQTRINSMLNVRDQFPAIENWHYLDSAATAQKPQAVIDAVTEAYSRDYATVHRGVYERSASMTASYEAARAAASNLIGGQP